MINGLRSLAVGGWLVIATIGLAGGGPEWFAYVGSATLLLLLVLVLMQLANTPSRDELIQILKNLEAHEVRQGPLLSPGDGARMDSAEPRLKN